MRVKSLCPCLTRRLGTCRKEIFPRPFPFCSTFLRWTHEIQSASTGWYALDGHYKLSHVQIIVQGNLFHYHMKETKKALQFYTLAIEIDPNNNSAYYQRACLYCYELEQYEEAVDDFSTSISLNPREPRAFLNRGLLFHDFLKKFDKAYEDYSTAIKLVCSCIVAASSSSSCEQKQGPTLFRCLHQQSTAALD